MSVRAALSSLSLVVLGAIICLAALLMTGSLALDSSAPSEPTATLAEQSPTQSAPATIASTTPNTQPPVSPPEPAASEPVADVGVAEVALATVNGTIAEPGPDAYVETFDTPDGFYDRFDYGFSGQNPTSHPSSQRVTSWSGDHDASCGGPDTSRTIDLGADTNEVFGGSYTDFSDLFWACKSHLMTGLSSTGYNIAWFSPKPLFTDITRVCWDINLTEVASRKWTQVLFVSEADAARYPSDRGSGGFDLGYTNPMFHDPGGPHANVFPAAGDLAGVQILQRGIFRWFENETQWTTEFPGAAVDGNFDKATRYTHCLEQIAPGTIRISQERPDSHGGFMQLDVPGTIPTGPVRVVFQDDNYNGPKSPNYNPDYNTWHWDDIVIE